MKSCIALSTVKLSDICMDQWRTDDSIALVQVVDAVVL